MTQMNPLTGALVGALVVQPRQDAEKARQLRRQQNLKRDSSLRGDEFEHQVDSADALDGVGDRRENDQPPPRKNSAKPAKPGDEDRPRLHLSA